MVRLLLSQLALVTGALMYTLFTKLWRLYDHADTATIRGGRDAYPSIPIGQACRGATRSPLEAGPPVAYPDMRAIQATRG
jgi:hypothetical protein